MTKDELLAEARRLATAGQLTRAELLAAYDAGSPSQRLPSARRATATSALQVTGGLIVLLGVVFLIQQNWSVFPSLVRILVTLGAAVLLYGAGAVLTTSGQARGASTAFLLLSTFLAPAGLAVTLHEANVEWWRAGPQVLQSVFFFAVFLASRFALRRRFYTFFAIFFATYAYYALITWFLPEKAMLTLRIDLIYEYATLLLGLGYVLLGAALARTTERSYADLLYFFGLLAFFSAAFALAGVHLQSPTNIVWEILLPGLAAAAIVLGIPLQTRSFLFVGVLALAGDVVKITSVYFPDTLGWPVALIIAGFSLIGIGYLALALNRRLSADRSATALSVPHQT